MRDFPSRFAGPGGFSKNRSPASDRGFRWPLANSFLFNSVPHSKPTAKTQMAQLALMAHFVRILFRNRLSSTRRQSFLQSGPQLAESTLRLELGQRKVSALQRRAPAFIFPGMDLQFFLLPFVARLFRFLTFAALLPGGEVF